MICVPGVQFLLHRLVAVFPYPMYIVPTEGVDNISMPRQAQTVQRYALRSPRLAGPERYPLLNTRADMPSIVAAVGALFDTTLGPRRLLRPMATYWVRWALAVIQHIATEYRRAISEEGAALQQS